MGEGGFSKAWLDMTHIYINRILCQPSVWFDNFFGEQRVGEEWPGTLVRWKNDYRFDEKEGGIYHSEFDASLRLPKASSKLKLIIVSESGDDESSDPVDDDPYNLDPSLPGDNQRQTNTGLLYIFSETRRFKAQVGGGVRFDTPLDPYVRVRMRITEPLGSSSLIRITPAVILYRDEGLSRSLRLDLDRRVGENILLRASQSGAWKEGRPGIRWGTEFSFLERLSQKTVLKIRAGATGETKPSVYTERYILTLRLRSNLFRPWLFLEMEPELYWPRDEEDRYRKYHALTVRVEIQFYS